MSEPTKLATPSSVGGYTFIRHLAPICRVHHLAYSYGWVLLPILPRTIGYFEFGRSHDKYGNWNPKWALRLAKKKDFHNCTWTGIY